MEWDELVRKWEEDEPGVADVDTPPVSPEAPAESVLPEMDLSSSEPARLPPPEQLRPQPATVGAGAVGGMPRGGSLSRRPLPAQPTASSALDWKELGDRMNKAHVADDVSRSSEHYLANAANPGAYREKRDVGENVAAAKLPLELAQAKQGLERGELANEAARSKIGADTADRDPSSLQSQKARESFKAFFGGTVQLPAGIDNWSAADIKRFASTGDMARILAAKNAAGDDARKQAAGQHQAEAAEVALGNSRKAFAGELKKLGIDPTNASQKDIDRAIQLAAAKTREGLAREANDRAENPKLPPGQVAEVADYKTAAHVADQLLNDYESAGLEGIASKAAGKVSDATGADLGGVSMYNDKANTAAQTIGLALEGGKLGEADLPRYRAMMPQAGDSVARARAKRDNLKRALADKAAGRSTEWLKAGYRVPGADAQTPPIPQAGPRPQADGVRIRRKKDGVVAPVARDVAERLISRGDYEPE